MRLVRYGVAMSLDCYIAGPSGEYDWIVTDPDVDFSGMMTEFDTFLIGRKMFEAMRRMGSEKEPASGTQNIVFSRTLRPADHPHVVVRDDAGRFVTELCTKSRKGIALFGGGELFRSLLRAFRCFRPPPQGRHSKYQNTACTRRPARSESNTTLSDLINIPLRSPTKARWVYLRSAVVVGITGQS